MLTTIALIVIGILAAISLIWHFFHGIIKITVTKAEAISLGATMGCILKRSFPTGRPLGGSWISQNCFDLATSIDQQVCSGAHDIRFVRFQAETIALMIKAELMMLEKEEGDVPDWPATRANILAVHNKFARIARCNELHFRDASTPPPLPN
jgi:hypothetical protein